MFLINTPILQADEAEFFAGSFKEAQQKAAREGKLLLIDFMADWCAPCKAMDQFTFPNQQVAAYMKANYIAYRANIDDFAGYDLKQQFNVKVLPTIVVLNTNSSIVGRHEEAMTPQRLMEVLRTYDIPKNRETPVKTAPSPVVPKASLSQDYSKSPESPIHLPAPVSKPASATAVRNTSVVKSAERPVATAGFKLTSENQTGYCVQTGTYGKYNNAANEVKRLKTLFPDQNVYVHIGSLNGATAYKIMVGSCSTRQQATALQTKVRSKGVACFIQDLSLVTKSKN